MGVESTSILLRWCFEESVRPCPLDELIVLVAQTGDEHLDTGRDVENYILPLVRAHRIRFVQVARGGPREADGIRVLSDTREPYHIHLEGAYRLSDELRRNGTVPQYSSQHRCSLKFKAFVLEKWLAENIRGTARHAFGYNCDESARIARSEAAQHERIAFGFNAEETERVERSKTYNTLTRTAFYPLVEWGWNRVRCAEYIRSRIGREWRRSACTFCPFSKLDDAAIARQREYPEQIGDALMLEHVSLSLNPRATLYRDRSLLEVVNAASNAPALESYQRKLATSPWAVYRVRRVYSSRAKADGAIECDAKFPSAAEALAHLHSVAATRKIAIAEMRGIQFAFVERRSASEFPCREEYFVAAPALVEEKARYGLPWFEAKWSAVQLQLVF
jgi:hypothetical protein